MVFMVLFWEWDDDYSMVIIRIIPPFTKHQYEKRGLNIFFGGNFHQLEMKIMKIPSGKLT